MAKIQKLADAMGSAENQKSEEKILIEKFKIEDSVHKNHGVEPEHFLLLKYQALYDN